MEGAMYLASDFNAGIDSVKNKLLGTPSAYYVAHCLNRVFKKDRIKFNHVHDKSIDKYDYAVTGQYDMTEDIRYITFIVSANTGHVSITESQWREFKFLTSQVMQHESIHQYQYSFRDCSMIKCQVDFRPWSLDKESEKDYLRDTDEIEAYAHDIIMEILYHYPKRDPKEVLRNIDRTRKLWSYTYYKKTFRGSDEWSVIRNQLLKKAYKWVPHTIV
jgi:hypothetical protein